MIGFAEEEFAYSAPMSKAAFLQWVQGQKARYELKGGKAIMHPGGTKRHGWIAVNFVTALRSRLAAETWAIGTADLAVEVGEDIRYPDLVVERLADDGSALSTDRPVLLVEVLSPSSVGTDMTAKVAEYTSLASLAAYIVASQDEPLCWVWQRSGPEQRFPDLPEEIAGRDKTIAIAALGIELPMDEIIRGIGSA